MTLAEMPPVSFEEYLRLPGVNWSTLKAMIDSPAHYLAALDKGRADTAALQTGRLLDTLIFTPELVDARYVVSPYDAYTTNAARAWKAETIASGFEPVKADALVEAQALADAVRRHQVARKYLDAGRFQVPLVWTDLRTGLACKGLTDLIGTSDGGFLIDGKSARTIDKRRYLSQAASLGYHFQLAHYRDGYAAVFGEPPAFIGHIVYEKGAPYDVGVLRFDRTVIDAAWVTVHELLDRVAECQESGEWPGRYPELVPVTIDDMPRWLMSEEDESAEELGITSTS